MEYKVTVIIPYKKNRGWLQDAIDSVPDNVQLILAQGNGTWPQNFNKALPRATGDYIKYLHDDDRLTENCIEDSIKAFYDQDCDFIHGNALNYHSEGHGRTIPYMPAIKYPKLDSQLQHNVMHSATFMFRKDVFRKIGGFDESLIWSEEYEFTLRCLHAGLKVGYCNAFLAYYRIHQGQKSNADQIARHINREEIKKRYR